MLNAIGLHIEVKKHVVIKAHINKKREAHSSLASLIRRPGNCPHCRNEQLRTSRRYDISNPYTHYTYGADTP